MEKDLKKEGYSKEEEYFHKLNQELIKKLAKQRRAAEDDKASSDAAG